MQHRLRSRLITFGSLLVLAYVFFARGLGYAFWQDDWRYLWLGLHPPAFPVIAWLHPATLLEFMVFVRAFGMDPALWQHAGIVLKAGAAFAVMDMAEVLFVSRMTAWIVAGIFVTWPLGMEAVNWPSAHVVNVEVLLFCEAVAWYVRYRRGKKRLSHAARWFAAAFVADPLRSLALAWVPLFLGSRMLLSRLRKMRRRTMAVAGIVALCGFGLGIATVWPGFHRWREHSEGGGVIGAHVLRSVVYAASMVWYLMTGWMRTIPHFFGTKNYGIFRPVEALFGIISILGAVAYLWFHRKRIRQAWRYRVLACAVLWILVTAGIQWIGEPELIPGTAHRYMVLPSVGLALLFGWGISRLPPRVMAAALLMYVLIVWRTGAILFDEMDTYRLRTTDDALWQLIDRTVPERGLPPIIVMEGVQYTKANYADDYLAHFTLLRSARGITQTAQFTTDYDDVAALLCRNIGFPVQYRMSDVYVFMVAAPDIVYDDSDAFREWLAADPAVRERCAAVSAR